VEGGVAEAPSGPLRGAQAGASEPPEPDAFARALARDTAAGRTRVLQAPSGAKPSHLLGEIAEQLGAHLRVAHLAAPSGDPESLARVTLEAATGVSPVDALFALDAYLLHLRDTGSGLVLMIDDVSGLPPATTSWLRRQLATSRGSLRVVAAAPSGPAALHAASRLGVVLAAAVPVDAAPVSPAAWLDRVEPRHLALAAAGAAGLALLLWSLL
jgi:hypothetical protein